MKGKKTMRPHFHDLKKITESKQDNFLEKMVDLRYDLDNITEKDFVQFGELSVDGLHRMVFMEFSPYYDDSPDKIDTQKKILENLIDVASLCLFYYINLPDIDDQSSLEQLSKGE